MRLKELRKQHGYTQQQLADKLKVTQAAYSGWESEKYEPDFGYIVELADLYNVTLDYLLEREEIATKSKQTLTPVKLMHNMCAAGNGFYLEGDSYEIVELPNVPSGTDYAVQIRGDSMEPLFHDSQVIFIKAQNSVEIGEIGLFSYEGNGYLKQCGNGVLVSLNAKYEPIKIENIDSFKCFGKVIK